MDSITNHSDALYFDRKKFSDTLVDKAVRFLSYGRMTINDIRKAKLEALIKEFGSLRALAEKLEHSSTAQISQWKQSAPDSRTGKPRTISNRSARDIELKCGKPEGWMDTPDQPAQSKLFDDIAWVMAHGNDDHKSMLLGTVDVLIGRVGKDQRTKELPVAIDRRKKA